MSELLVIARLIEAGHKVAVPVCDDDGVDLVVNYRTTVQIKSSQMVMLAYGDEPARYRFWAFKNPRRRYDADFYIFHGRGEEETWWVIPRHVLRQAEVKSSISLYAGPGGKSKRTAHFHEFIDAWDVFDALR